MFLDEPTIGLDPVVKENVRELIRQMNREEHTTIFLTSHDVGDIEKLCSRIIIVNDGQIVLDDSVPAAGGCGWVHVSGDPVTLGARGSVLRTFAHSVCKGVSRFLLYFIIPVGMAVFYRGLRRYASGNLMEARL